MTRKPPAPRRLTSTGAFRAYLRETDDLVQRVTSGQLTPAGATEAQLKLAEVLRAQLRRIFAERLPAADERPVEPARIETYPVPRLVDLASSEVVRTCAHRSPASEDASSPGPRAAGDLPGPVPADPEVPADPGPPAGGE